MKYLVDTHVLLWYSEGNGRLPHAAREVLLSGDSELHVSIASIWETGIKASLGRPSFDIDPGLLLDGLLKLGWLELSVSARHISGLRDLPHHHGDPFDRMLVSQAKEEQLTLLTSDKQLLRYDVPILFVG